MQYYNKSKFTNIKYILSHNNEIWLLVVFVISLFIYFVSLMKPPVLFFFSGTFIEDILTSQVFIRSSNNISLALFSAYIVYYLSYITSTAKDYDIANSILTSQYISNLKFLRETVETGNFLNTMNYGDYNLKEESKIIADLYVSINDDVDLEGFLCNERANLVVNRLLSVSGGFLSEDIKCIKGFFKELKYYYGFYSASQMRTIHTIIWHLNAINTRIEEIKSLPNDDISSLNRHKSMLFNNICAYAMSLAQEFNRDD
ncbi:hypothetical protein [Vibrio parahaemolyticus]|uniref:Uncharacterized protein n=1 Tax=Vibrio parahaemolyticus TaxID=670 RepID=A0AA46L1E5_VIBPH|nr:hypothetical protein [Vibrio parahaemolyticus]TXN13583.1 hypothetical protein FVP01_23075 [Vibrio parahaemolyticus]